jgi:hypothetical protein
VYPPFNARPKQEGTMTMTHLNFKTICLSAGLTTMLITGPVQTAHGREQTSIGFHISVRDDDYRKHRDHYRGLDRRDHYRWNHRWPRYNHPRYYRRDYSNWRYDYRPNYYNDRDHDRLFATAAGVFFGVLIGSEIIRYMNDVDYLRAREANLAA